MNEASELTAAARAVETLVRECRARNGFGDYGCGPELSYVGALRGDWHASVQLRTRGTSQHLSTWNDDPRGALLELRRALEDMLEGRRAMVGGDTATPVPPAPQRPYPAVGQVWSFTRGDYEYREVEVIGVGAPEAGLDNPRADGRERAQLRNLATGRTTPVLTETMLRPGSGWAYLRSEEATG